MVSFFYNECFFADPGRRHLSPQAPVYPIISGEVSTMGWCCQDDYRCLSNCKTTAFRQLREPQLANSINPANPVCKSKIIFYFPRNLKNTEEMFFLFFIIIQMVTGLILLKHHSTVLCFRHDGRVRLPFRICVHLQINWWYIHNNRVPACAPSPLQRLSSGVLDNQMQIRPGFW